MSRGAMAVGIGLVIVVGLACDDESDAAFRSEAAAVDPEPGGGGFLPRPDVGGSSSSFECSNFAQDCVAGYKCMPWASDGGTWNAVRCTALAENPGAPGDPCTVEGGGASGIDDCERGAMCWHVDPKTLTGTCVAMQLGGAEHPVCADPLTRPRSWSSGALSHCLPACSPLAPDCPGTIGCTPIAGGEEPTEFVCEWGSGGKEGDLCSGSPCDAGLVCYPPGELAGCDSYCCTPLCDVTQPDCGDGKVCRPWYEPGNAWPGLDDVGVCVTGN